jgi:hypothetical protein
MAYDLIQLTTRAMCDRATALAEEVQSDLVFELSLYTRRGANVSEGAAATDANLDAATAEVDALTASVSAMAEGLTKDKYARRLRRATERKTQLTDRLTDFDGVVLTDNQFDRRRLNASLAEANTYLGELAAHKATLPA